MKRKSAILAAALILVLTLAMPVFASDLLTVSPSNSSDLLIAPNPMSGLVVENILPEDGSTGLQPANVAVKIVFNADVNDRENDFENSSKIKITDPEGNKIKFEIKHHPKYTNEIWCILSEDLLANTTYNVEVAAGIIGNDGAVLSAGHTSSFTTRNTKVDNRISVVLSVAMMVIMIYATSKATKDAASDSNAKAKPVPTEKPVQTDPYRLAREQGISVEEAKAQIAKEKEKLARKYASDIRAKEKYDKLQEEKEAEIARRLQEIHDANVYKVKTKGSLKGHGHQLPKSLEKKLAEKAKKSKKK